MTFESATSWRHVAAAGDPPVGELAGILIEIGDTGSGMSVQYLPRALLPFVRLANPPTSESEGTGLGLPLSKRLAELHGATLTIASTVGVGTVCTLRFPAWRSLAAAPPPA